MTQSTVRRGVVAVIAMLLLTMAQAGVAADTPPVAAPSRVASGAGLSNTLGTINDAEMWRGVRQGEAGYVSIPNKQAGVLVQANGETWRLWRNGPITVVGAVMFWLMVAVVGAFYLLRGKVRIQGGLSGRKILRFKFVERFTHWLTAGSFLILAVTGVNLLYGRHVLPAIIGLDAFAELTRIGKYVHNFVGFAFVLGLVLMFVIWVKNNIWDRYDWNWIKKGGGLLFPKEHPPAGKFNFGQKTVFWMVMGGGGILAVTGLNLLFPFYLAGLEQMQWIQAIHSTLSQIMCLLMVAHIYIGTIGMQGAFEAMSTGYVDRNWAREHHRAWLDDVEAKGPGDGEGSPSVATPRQAPAE
jgi:formate dehydrogenase subunit gamma